MITKFLYATKKIPLRIKLNSSPQETESSSAHGIANIDINPGVLVGMSDEQI